MSSILFVKGLMAAKVRVREVAVVVIKLYSSSRRLAFALFFLVIFVFFIQFSAYARSRFELVMNYLNQKGESGNQVFDGSGDQSMTVYEPKLFFDADIGANTTIFGDLAVDMWSSASDMIIDTASGASGSSVTTEEGGGLQSRIGVNFGVSQKFKTWTFIPRVGYSKEFDYQSVNGGLTVQKTFAEDNFTLSAGTQYYNDAVNVYDVEEGEFDGYASKRILNMYMGASQILSPVDLISFEYSFTNQSGYLAGNVNSVSLSGSRVNEVLPNKRNRHSAMLRYVHGFSEKFAGHLDYKFYLDDWGITAHMIEPSVYVSLLDDALLLKFAYRFYAQSASNYSASSFRSRQEFMTSDSDLDAFIANEVSFHGSYKWLLGNSFIKAIEPGISASYYYRDNDLGGAIIQLNAAIEF
jgi:hypothetical protein